MQADRGRLTKATLPKPPTSNLLAYLIPHLHLNLNQMLVSHIRYPISNILQLRNAVLFLALLAIDLPRCGAQSEVGLILNAVLQGLQAAEAIRQSVDRANQFPNGPNQPAGDPIWQYDESTLVPILVLKKGPYRNVQGDLVVSARQTQPDTIELLFYGPNGEIIRREFCRPDRRDGRRIDFDLKAQKISEGRMLNGLPEGDWQFYASDGKLKAETRMLNGKMTGPQVLFNEDGKTRASNTLLDGKREGPSTLFHPDGSVSDNLYYVGDKLNGPATGWWPDGQPRYSANWKDGKLDGLSTENFPSGAKKSEATYVLGKKEGIARTWNGQGQLQLEENWQNDRLEGVAREFYPDGKTRTETTYLNGQKNGPYRSLNPDGTFASSAEFMNGRLAGPILLHYPDGKTFAECHYDGDRLTGGRLLYPDGKVLGQFGPVLEKADKVSSLMLQYTDGKPLSTARYDLLTGKTEWQGWKPDGSLLGQLELPLHLNPNLHPQTELWSTQQAELEQQIGLSFPPELNLLQK